MRFRTNFKSYYYGEKSIFKFFTVRSNKDKCIEHKSLLLLKSIICNHTQKLCYSTNHLYFSLSLKKLVFERESNNISKIHDSRLCLF